jgi:hypothetical protein
MAGKLFLSDRPDLIYDPMAQLQSLNVLIAPLSFTNTERFTHSQLYYPPFFFALMAPFAVLPTTMAYVLWTLLCLGGGMYATSLILKRTDILTHRQQLFFLAACIVYLPVSQSIQIGYSSLLLFALVSAYFIFFQKRRDILAGMFLALTTIKFQYIWALLIPVVILKRFKLAASAFIGLVLLVGLSALRVGVSTVINYPSSLMNAEHATNINQMVNFRGLFFNLLPESLAFPATALTTVMGGLFLLYVWIVAVREYNQKDKNAQHWAIALTAVSCLLFSPHVQMSDCALLIIAAAYTLPMIDFQSAWSLKSMALKIWCMTILLSPLISVALFVYWAVLNHWWTMGLDPFALYNLIMFASGAVYFCQTFSKPRTDKPHEVPAVKLL